MQPGPHGASEPWGPLFLTGIRNLALIQTSSGRPERIIWSRRSDIAEGSGDGFFHSETFVLLDGQRKFQGVYNGTPAFEVEQLV